MSADHPPPQRRRRPASVYASGTDPDPRFTFANERTFLAWIRTALALLAAGVALEALDIPDARTPRTVLVVALAALGVLSAGSAYFRWARAERALRENRPLPAPALAPLISFGIVVIAAAAVALIIAE